MKSETINHDINESIGSLTAVVARGIRTKFNL